MQNYARYGSYYAELLSSLETNYPGLKYQLSTYNTHQDMLGEQTICRNTKTSQCIKQFAGSSSSVQKWCLNRYFLYISE